MRQVIPFTKNIVFKTNIANIVSISLEHEEKVFDEEISGEFIVYGEYKEHLDTTENKSFKYNLPFSTLYPDNLDKDTIKIDITDFTYEQIEDDVLKVDISFVLLGDELEDRVDDLIMDYAVSQPVVIDPDNDILDSKEVTNEDDVTLEEDDYIVYKIHIVKREETIENILKIYDVCMDDLKEYNDVSKIKEGDKLIIPCKDEY